MQLQSQKMNNKALLIGFLLIFTISFGCKKPPLPVPDPTTDGSGSGGGGGNTEEPSPYVGSWDYDEIVFTDGVLSFQGNNVGTFVGEGINIKGTFTVSEDPNVWESSVDFTASIDATFFGQTQNQEAPIDKQLNSGTWTESNGEISLVDDVTGNVTVISSTSSKIIFTDNFTETITIGQGFEVDANSDVEFTLVK